MYLPMVKVITIRDDVYDRLSDLKKRNLMSFSQAIDMLLREGKETREGLFEKAGMLKESAIDRNVLRRLRSWETADQTNEIMP